MQEPSYYNQSVARLNNNEDPRGCYTGILILFYWITFKFKNVWEWRIYIFSFVIVITSKIYWTYRSYILKMCLRLTWERRGMYTYASFKWPLNNKVHLKFNPTQPRFIHGGHTTCLYKSTTLFEIPSDFILPKHYITRNDFWDTCKTYDIK